jgi:hypothetical protein
MPISADLLQAKQTLSARLLRAGLQGHAVSLSHTINIHAAIASAGRNVHAVGVGRKIVNGTPTETFAVRIYVAQKIAPSLLPPRDRLPETIDGLSTDIIESPPAFLAARKSRKSSAKAAATVKAAVKAAAQTCTDNRRQRQRPVLGGISTAHRNVTAGTIACFCRSTRHGDDPTTVHVLSNNHVFANVNRAQIGDDLFQPGPADGGTNNDHFADLHRFVQLKLGGEVPNRVDAAIGALRPGVEFRPEICQIGRISGIGQAVEGLAVLKHGRTTGLTEGVVTDESVNSLVGMDHADPTVVALFENQLRVDLVAPHPAIGLGGDSGSLVLSRAETEAVGLYFANPPSGEYGLANHIADVLAELQIELS